MDQGVSQTQLGIRFIRISKKLIIYDQKTRRHTEDRGRMGRFRALAFMLHAPVLAHESSGAAKHSGITRGSNLRSVFCFDLRV
jgi:hypothetical protein